MRARLPDKALYIPELIVLSRLIWSYSVFRQKNAVCLDPLSGTSMKKRVYGELVIK
jgi:hypothetical protein